MESLLLKYCHFFLFLLVMINNSFSQEAWSRADSGWIPLWNGKDIKGFYVHVSGKGIVTKEKIEEQTAFEIRNGMIYSNFDGYGLLVSLKEFSHYEMTIDYMFENVSPNTEKNAGLVIHVDNESMLQGITSALRGVSIEVNMRQTDDSPWTLWSASRYGPYLDSYVRPGSRDFLEATEGGVPWTNNPWGNRVLYSSYTNTEKPLGEWNTGEVYMRGDSIGIYTLNGQIRTKAWNFRVPLDRNNPSPADSRLWGAGGVGVQAEQHAVWYRNWEIRELDSLTGEPLIPGCADQKFLEYKPFRTVDDNSMCQTPVGVNFKNINLENKIKIQAKEGVLNFEFPQSGKYSVELKNIKGNTIDRFTISFQEKFSNSIAKFKVGIYPIVIKLKGKVIKRQIVVFH